MPRLWWFLPACGLLLYFWPVTYRLSLSLRPRHQEVSLRVAGLLAQVRVRALRQPPGPGRLSVEIRWLHVFPLRRDVLGTSPGWGRWGSFLDTPDQWGREAGRAWSGMPSARRIPVAGVAARWARWRPVLRALRSGSRFWWRHLRLGPTHLHLRLGLEDAATTALTCACAWAVLGTALGHAQRRLRFRKRPEIHLIPVYGRRLLHVELRSAAGMRQGEALLACLLTLGSYLKEKAAAALRRGDRPGGR